MTTIHFETFIHAPVERVFDLSRSTDLHKKSAKQTKEEAIAGRTTGLIDLNETVTWKAKHFGIFQTMTVLIYEFERPDFFSDKMIKGAFASMEHIHKFEKVDAGTMMIDEFKFTAPIGVLGKIAEALFLKAYMKKLLLIRNREIKNIAEGEEWRKFINP